MEEWANQSVPSKCLAKAEFIAPVPGTPSWPPNASMALSSP